MNLNLSPEYQDPIQVRASQAMPGGLYILSE